MLSNVSEVLNMDAVVETIMAGIIEGARHSDLLSRVGAVPTFERWAPGKPLRVLLVGYNGARNTGADVRVEAMVRQFYQVLGKDNVHIGVMTLDASHSQIYYRPPTELIEFSSVFFHDLLKACSAYHLAVLSEGSCFKSKFANALTTFFFGAAGIMRSQGKPVIAYGSEAGKMDWLLRDLVKRYCTDAYIISRTEPSMRVSEDLGLAGELGTDTAWIFQPGAASLAESELRAKGWDGKQPILGAAVINPFYWPVRPNLTRFVKTALLRQEPEDHYDKWYFFSSSAERTRKFDAYIGAIADAVDGFVERHDVFPIIIGMERLDLGPNQALQRRMRHPAPIFCSEDYDGYLLTAVLGKLALLATSRYHARVLSMLFGVPSAGVSMDERLENLLRETGHIDDYYLAAEDPELCSKLPAVLDKLWQNRDTVREQLLRSVPGYLRKMARMGQTMRELVSRRFPEFPLPPAPADWQGYLPPLYPELQQLVDKYG